MRTNKDKRYRSSLLMQNDAIIKMFERCVKATP